MTDQEINIAIAEACGWKWNEPNCHWLRPDSSIPSITVPDYCHDLNAMHEAEKTLWESNDWAACKYEEALMKDTHDWAWHATARQRAEAFLRCKGLWKD